MVSFLWLLSNFFFIFYFFKFQCDVPRGFVCSCSCLFVCLTFILGGLGPVLQCLILTWGNCCHYFCKIFLPLLSSPSGALIHDYVTPLVAVSQVVEALSWGGFLLCFFSLLLEVSIVISPGAKILSSAVSNILVIPSKAFLLSLVLFFFNLQHFSFILS